ncbi:MAG: acyltransferase [Dehalococcoidia bacterium]
MDPQNDTPEKPSGPAVEPPGGGAVDGIRRVSRPVALPLDRLLIRANVWRLRWIHLREGIGGIEAELRRMRADHARVLRTFGAAVAEDASIVGPVSLTNSARDFSNLVIGSLTHVGSEAFFDLAGPITIEEGATISMRAVIITHLDVGRGPLAARRPRRVAPVRICEGAFVGAGAVILDGVTVGREAVVGAGVVVDSDIPDGAVVRRPG